MEAALLDVGKKLILKSVNKAAKEAVDAINKDEELIGKLIYFMPLLTNSVYGNPKFTYLYVQDIKVPVTLNDL